MNGTCNYILTKMANEGRSFADVLKEAQALGYAEADPTFDVGGFDTAHKLAVLTSLAFGTEVNLKAIDIEGIEQITLDDIRNAGEHGLQDQAAGRCRGARGAASSSACTRRWSARARPWRIPMACSTRSWSRATSWATCMLEGRGAGAHPTASAVLSDIVDIARGNWRPAFGVPARDLKPYQAPRPQKAHEGGFYVALELHDKPGAVAAVARILADEKISIESIVQRGKTEKDAPRATAPFILITHDTVETAMRAALARIEKDGHVAGHPRMIRIERL